MKIEHILGYFHADNIIDHRHSFNQSYGGERCRLNPELATLLTARDANRLLDCIFLSDDELEFANLIIKNLDMDPSYVPSMVLLTAVRGVNAKLAVGPQIPS